MSERLQGIARDTGQDRDVGAHGAVVYLILLGLLWIGFAVRLWALDRQNIWWDEARNIDVALRPFWQIATAPELDIHPPVYFWLLHGWGWFFGVESGMPPEQVAYVGRLLSVFAGVVGIALLYPLARRAGGQWGAVVAMGIGAFSPFWLAESQETRMYTVGIALLMGAALALLHGLAQIPAADAVEPGQAIPLPSATRRALGIFVLLSALALLTHYNAVFILLAWYGWWGVWSLLRPDRWRQVRAVVVTGIVTIVLVAPVTPIALRQIPGYENPNLGIPTVGAYLWQNWQAYVGGYAFDGGLVFGWGNVWLWTMLGVALIGMLIALVAWRTTHRASDRLAAISFLVVWLVGGLALYYIAVVDRGAFNVRYSSFVTPALYCLIGVAIAGWRSLWMPLSVLATGVLLVGAVVGVHADITDAHFEREDIAGVTRWLRENAGPEDVILVDQKYPFGFYYEGYGIDPEDRVEVTQENGEHAPARYLFVDVNTIDARLMEVAADAAHVFWVQWYESDTDPRRAVSFLLDKAGTRVGEELFQGYEIDWWQMEPPNEFVLAPEMAPVDLTFANRVKTIEVSLPAEPLQPGGQLPVVIRWQRVPGGTVDVPLKARVALYDANEGRVAQNDQRLLNDRHLLPAEWGAEDMPLNVYMLDVPDEMAAGEYPVRLLVYHADTLEPLTLIDVAGNPAGIEGTLGTVTVTGSP